MISCPLCHPENENLVWQDDSCRVILLDDSAYPGFCRVIWADHVAEMTDLTPVQQQHLLRVVLATEQALRHLMKPDKINLASLGNMVPHLHWHVIPRFRDDAHFPDPIWAKAHREGTHQLAPSAKQIAADLALALNNKQGLQTPA